jgi:methionyl-tRNA formyltransferase
VSDRDVDLFIGGDLGKWALQWVPKKHVRQIFTKDNDIVSMANKLGVNVWMNEPDSLDYESSERGISVHYPRILGKSVISRYRNLYNLHPGYLPWGRGYYPIFWAMFENTPAGATLHEITEKVDAGPIVAQVRVESYPDDTGGSLFERVRKAEKELFQQYWRKIITDDEIPSCPQPSGGSYHSKKEFLEIKKHSDWQNMNGKDLIHLVRCLTFPGYTGLEVKLGNNSFELHLEPLQQKDNPIAQETAE